MQPKHPWLKKCLQNLEELPQIETTATIEPFLDKTLADGLLTIYTPYHEIRYVVEIKSPLTLETIDSTLDYLNHLKQHLSHGQRPLLVTDTLSDAVFNELLERNIEFLDTTGNIYLNNSSIYILLKSNSIQSKKSSSDTKITRSTLKVAYALLQNPSILERNLQVIAEVAGVDLKTVKSSLDSLYKLNYLQRQSGRQYRIDNYTKLLERWEMGYVENLRAELLINTFTLVGNMNFTDISDKLLESAKTHSILIGGELGAAILTKYLRPISAVLHVPQGENYRIITAQLRLKPDPTGSITLLKQFGTQNSFQDFGEKIIAEPLLIHAELALHPDERLKETANRIYDQYISKREKMLT